MTRAAIAHGDVIPAEATALHRGTYDSPAAYNIADLATYAEVQQRGLDRYFSQEAWQAMRQREEVNAG